MGAKKSTLTKRQEWWLSHLRRAAQAGETVRAYAKRHRLSEAGMYQAAKELRRRGALAPAAPRAERKAVATPRFVEVRPKPAASELREPAGWRARLPNGVVVEGSGDALRLLEALHRL